MQIQQPQDEFRFGQRVILGGYQLAVITGFHFANHSIIHSCDLKRHTEYPETVWSVTWQDSIGVVITMEYDRTALLGNDNLPGVDRW